MAFCVSFPRVGTEFRDLCEGYEMARPSKMWWREDRKSWFVTIKGQRFKLGADEEKAKQEFHRLMSLDEPPAPKTEVLAIEIFDKFLLWTKANREPRTYSWYRDHIQAFIDKLPNQRITAEDLKPLHVTEHLKSSWSPSYTRGRMLAIQRAFKWAVAQGYLDKSPLASLEKPAATRRDNCPTKAEIDQLLSLSKEPFKSLLEFMIETGCRPHEAVIMEARHFKGDTIEFMVKESKGKSRKRIVYLNDRAKAIVQSQISTNELVQSETVFTNRNGDPWKAYAIDNRLKRLAKKTGKKIAAVDVRHYRATAWLESGVDHFTVAAWLGHSTPAMVVKTYGHIGQNSQRLLEKLRSIN